MAVVKVTQGETDRFRISNAINKNAQQLDLYSTVSRDYGLITESVMASEDYGSIV